jgi:hypothetical protein
VRVVLAAVLVAMAAAGTAQAEVVDDNPAASSRGAGQVSVFLRGSDGTLQQSDLSRGTFTPWRSLGGGLLSGPAAGGRSTTVSSVAARGLDAGIWHKAFQGGAWSGWQGLGGHSISAPAMDVRRSQGIVDLFWRGTDNGIEAKSWVPGSGWTGINTTQVDPGTTLSAPAAVSRLDDSVDLIVRGTDDGVWVDTYRGGSGWGGWGQIPGGMRTQRAPAVTTRRAGTMDIFVRTAAGGVGWVTYDGAAWSAWKTVPGRVDSGLAAIADSPDRIYLFARRGRDVIWNLYDRGKGPQDGWNGWQSVHPPPPPPPPPLTCDGDSRRMSAHTKLVRYAHRPRIAGRARWPNGGPLANATISATPRRGGWIQRTTAAADGHYALRIPAGPSRTIRLQAWAPGASALACTTVKVKTRAGVRLKATRRVNPGGRVRFRGRLLGKPIPRRGKLVEIQAFDGGRWRTFAQPRSRRNGRFRTSYRLRHTFGPRTFHFRARVRREAGYPYELGRSRTVKVRVR